MELLGHSANILQLGANGGNVGEERPAIIAAVKTVYLPLIMVQLSLFLFAHFLSMTMAM